MVYKIINGLEQEPFEGVIIPWVRHYVVVKSSFKQTNEKLESKRAYGIVIWSYTKNANAASII